MKAQGISWRDSESDSVLFPWVEFLLRSTTTCSSIRLFEDYDRKTFLYESITCVILLASLILSPSSVFCPLVPTMFNLSRNISHSLNIGYFPPYSFPPFGRIISIVAYELLLEGMMHGMKINKDNSYLLFSFPSGWPCSHVSAR